MRHYPKSVLIVGLVIPAVMTAIIFTGSMMGFSHFHKTLKKKIAIYNAVNSCKQQLQGAREESQFLEAEISSLKGTHQFNKLISVLQNAISSEKGVQWINAESPSSDQRVLLIEGLSGPTVSSIGEAFRKCPTVLFDSWNIQKKSNGKVLSFNIKIALPTTEPRE